jgi:hypothetical protein
MVAPPQYWLKRYLTSMFKVVLFFCCSDMHGDAIRAIMMWTHDAIILVKVMAMLQSQSTQSFWYSFYSSTKPWRWWRGKFLTILSVS